MLQLLLQLLAPSGVFGTVADEGEVFGSLCYQGVLFFGGGGVTIYLCLPTFHTKCLGYPFFRTESTRNCLAGVGKENAPVVSFTNTEVRPFIKIVAPLRPFPGISFPLESNRPLVFT